MSTTRNYPERRPQISDDSYTLVIGSKNTKSTKSTLSIESSPDDALASLFMLNHHQNQFGQSRYHRL